MTIKKRLIIDLSFYSACSEADLLCYADYLISQIAGYANDLPTQSWNTHINTDWDESYRVETFVSAESVTR